MLEVTLKKASALAAALAATNVAIAHGFKINIYAEMPTPEDVFERREDFVRSLDSGLAVVDATFAIRDLVGRANEGEINALLTARAAIDRKLAILNAIPIRETGTDLNALANEIEAIHAAGNSTYTSPPLLELATADVVVPSIRALKKTRIAIEDNLARLNNTKTVSIPDNVVEILTGLDLV